ncbi:MAG: HAD family phosphatase [Bacteroidales bacterium]|nr:HAD family phosphatase [Bacteroidales bacterium]
MIKNLLFDLGGVIMDIEKENCVESYERLGLRNARRYFGEFSQQGPFMALEEGKITPDEFHAALRPELPDGVTDAEIDNAFCDFLTGIPVRRLAALRQLRRRYKVYLLSNTNPIMWESKIKDEFKKEGHIREDYFDGMVTSFEAKALKPDKAIFDYTIKKLGIDPAETLFLDDSEANLKAAARLGFNTALVAHENEFADIIEKYKDA